MSGKGAPAFTVGFVDGPRWVLRCTKCHRFVVTIPTTPWNCYVCHPPVLVPDVKPQEYPCRNCHDWTENHGDAGACGGGLSLFTPFTRAELASLEERARRAQQTPVTPLSIMAQLKGSLDGNFG